MGTPSLAGQRVAAYALQFQPAQHTRENLSVLLPLLDATAVSVDDTLSTHIGLTTPRASRVPVLLAAMAPRMLTMASQPTDSTAL